MLRLTHQVHHPAPMLDLDADSTVPFSIGTRSRGRLSGTVFPNGLAEARVSGSGPEDHLGEFEGFWDGTQVRLVNPTDLSDFFLLEAPFAQHNDTDKLRACPLWTARYPLLQESRDPLWVENTERNRMDGLRDKYLIATADRKVNKKELKGIPEDWSAMFRYRSRTGVVSVGSADRSGRVTVTTAHEVDNELSYTTFRGFYDGREVRVLPETWTPESQDRPVLFRIPELSKFIEDGEHAKKAIKSHKRRNQLLDRETGHDHRIAITTLPEPGVPSFAISRICPIQFSGTARSDTIKVPSEATVLLWGEKWEGNPSWELHKQEIKELSKYLQHSSLPEEAEVWYVQDSKCSHASFWVHCDPLINRQIVVENDIEPTAAWGVMPRHEEEAVFLHDPAAENRERMKFARKHERMKAEPPCRSEPGWCGDAIQ